MRPAQGQAQETLGVRLVGIEWHLSAGLGVEEELGGQDLAKKIDGFKGMINRVTNIPFC